MGLHFCLYLEKCQEDVSNFQRQQLLDLISRGLIPSVNQPGVGVLKNTGVAPEPFTPR